jgi:hypothetical protein
MSEAGRSTWRALCQPPFVICVVVLAAASVLAGPVAQKLRIALRKEAAYLRKPLDQVDRSRFGIYEFKDAGILDPAVLPTLGTDTYIDWVFEDRSIDDPKDPFRTVHLFITYYTGGSNLVPHVAEVCYKASGYLLESTQNEEATLDLDDGSTVKLPFRVASLRKSKLHDNQRVVVVYTFHCNGDFESTRGGVRAQISNPRDKAAYFCKVELSFGSNSSGRADMTNEGAIKAATKFFRTILPILVAEHFPDWKALEENWRSGQTKASPGQDLSSTGS